MASEAESRRAIEDVAKHFRESQAKLGNHISQEAAQKRIRTAVLAGEINDSERKR